MRNAGRLAPPIRGREAPTHPFGNGADRAPGASDRVRRNQVMGRDEATPRGGDDRDPDPVGVRKLDRTAEDRATADGYAGFAVAYDTHQTAIYAYVRRLMLNEADAEDLTVAAFEKALRAWERRPPEAELRPWLFRIATNACLDELRRRQRFQWQPWNAFIGLFHPSQIAPDNPEEEALRREKSGLVRAALARLGPRDRAALILREYQGLPVADVGQALGISPGAAKITLFRARERLRSIYLEMGGELPKDYWTTGSRPAANDTASTNGSTNGRSQPLAAEQSTNGSSHE